MEEKKEKRNIFSRIWKNMSPKWRAAAAGTAAVVVFFLPFPTVPIEMALLTVAISNSPLAQKVIANLRKKYPNRTEKIIGKIMKSKYAPDMLKDLLNETDPKVYFAKDKSNEKTQTSGKQKNNVIDKIRAYKERYFDSKKKEVAAPAPALKKAKTNVNNSAILAHKQKGR